MSRPAGMTRRMAVLAGCSAGTGLLLAPPALAHRSQTVLSTVMWNATASVLEVTHRLHPHDAELALQQTSGVLQVDITAVKNQAALMIYLEERFVLTDGGRKIALEPVGAEFEGDTLLMYQQCALKTPPARLAIDDRILRDVFEAQANLVNVRLAERTRTFLFSGNDGVKQAEGLL
ncbi:MAG: DUF6702 family protein [Hyphomonadaceae bacterium]